VGARGAGGKAAPHAKDTWGSYALLLFGPAPLAVLLGLTAWPAVAPQ
jgi:hypothetical protein